MAFESKELVQARAAFRERERMQDIPPGDVAELMKLGDYFTIYLNGHRLLQLVPPAATTWQGPESLVWTANSDADAKRKWSLTILGTEGSALLGLLCASSDHSHVGWRLALNNLTSVLTPRGELRVEMVGARERVYWSGELVGTRIQAWRDIDAERGIIARFVFEVPQSIIEMEAICALYLVPWQSL